MPTRQRRPGGASYLRVLLACYSCRMASEPARSLRKNMTRQEVKLWVKLRDLRELGFQFRRQSPIRSHVIDFECRRSQLVVEVDGGQHGFEAIRAKDVERDSALRAAGYRMLRFWNNQIDQELEAVLETIVAVLKEESPPGSHRSPPSPEGEG
jgi:very-short-patch-repair endonuclease